METLVAPTLDIRSLFTDQLLKAQQLKKSSVADRIIRLTKLKEALTNANDAMMEALYDDFKKPTEEAKLELGPIFSEIDFVVASLETWMNHSTVVTPDALGGEAVKSRVVYEPKGVCLFITPWNYPFLLTFRPLVSCLAAGNTVIIKPSELTPHSSSLMRQIVESVFEANEVAVVEGGGDVAAELLTLPFHHIFYTGGSRVGKIVMKAAANYLASVTLELGGKSPVILDDSADFSDAAGKIAWGKYFNCGQTCIAPDYVLVSENRKDEFVATMKATIEAMYGADGPGIDSPAYARMVNRNHYDRVKNLIKESVHQGASVITGGKTEDSESYISPTLLDNVNVSQPIMQEEILGPVLPVLTYQTLDDAIQFVNRGERPLALYVFGQDKNATEQVIRETTAGGSVVNHVIMHYFSPFLPFGGVGNSGSGRGNGYFGFLDFSNHRGVFEL